ncbi:MAG: glycosyltransferase family 2 protein [Propioniciclava sp.]
MNLSIVIPHFGDPAPTVALVESLRPQLADAEIIVVDDCSVTPFGDLTGAHVVRRTRNGGFGATCNSGAGVAQGAYLLFLNSDLEVGPTFVDDLVSAAAPYQPCVASPRMIDDSGATAATARAFPRTRHHVAAWLTPLARWRDTDAWHRAVGHDTATLRATSIAATDWLVGAALLIPRPDFEAVGGFDERFYMNSEEIDLQRRLRNRGLPALWVPSVSVHHAGGGSSDATRRRAWLTASHLRYAEVWGNPSRLRVALTAATLANLAWNAGRRALGREVHPLQTARDELALIHNTPTTGGAR